MGGRNFGLRIADLKKALRITGRVEEWKDGVRIQESEYRRTPETPNPNSEPSTDHS
jgi:hypothetical protein